MNAYNFFLIIFLLGGAFFCPLLSSPSSLKVWIEKKKMLNLFVIKKKEAKKGKYQAYINIKRSKRPKASKMTVCGLLLQLKQKWGSTSISHFHI